MLNFLKKYGKWLVLALSIFVFTFVTRQMLEDELASFDTFVHDFVIGFKNPYLTEVVKVITTFASAPFIIIVSIFLFYIFPSKKYGLLSLLSLIAVVGVNQILKFVFSRPRPFEWMLVPESGFSFPSGHAMVSMGFYGMLIYLIWQTNMNKRDKKIITVLLSILIILVGLSRIYLGVHYASDIIAGFALSLSYLIVATSIVSYYLKSKRNVLKKS